MKEGVDNIHGNVDVSADSDDRNTTNGEEGNYGDEIQKKTK
jgi:hypothetical protein